MDEEELNNQEDREFLKGSLLKYEEMVRNNDRYFFDVDTILHLAEYYQNRGHASRAYEVCSYGLDLHPEAVVILLKKATLASQDGKHIQALKMLENLETGHPYEVDIFLVKAKIFEELEDFKGCIKCLKKALEISNSDGFIYSELAAAYQMVFDYDAAIRNYMKALEIMPQDEIFLSDFYSCLLSADRMEEGLQFFQKMIDDNPYNADAWFFYGNLQSELNRYEKAIDAFDYCIVIDDLYEAAYIGKGDAFANLGKHHEAISNYMQSLKCIDPDVNVYTSIAESYDQLDIPTEARRYFRKVLKIYPGDARALHGMAMTYFGEGRYTEALRFARKAIGSNKGISEYWCTKGDCEFQLNNIEEAELSYTNALELNAGDEEATHSYALLLYLTGRKDEAVAQVLNGLKYNPDNIDLMYRLGCYLLACDKSEEAYLQLSFALDRDFEAHELIFEIMPHLVNDDNVIELIESRRRML